jgi:hypothetical protein
LDAEHQESARAVLVDTEAGEPREEWNGSSEGSLSTPPEDGKAVVMERTWVSGLAISFPIRKDDLADAVKNACAFLGKTENGFGPPEKPDGTGSESLERNRMGAQLPAGEVLRRCYTNAYIESTDGCLKWPIPYERDDFQCMRGNSEHKNLHRGR